MSEHFIDFLADELRWNGKSFLPLSNDPGTPGQPGPVSWNDVQNKPQKFPPQEHSHSVTDIGDLEQKLTEIVTDGEIVVKGEKGDKGDPGADGNGVQEVYVFDHVPTPDELVSVPENMLVVYGVTETIPCITNWAFPPRKRKKYLKQIRSEDGWTRAESDHGKHQHDYVTGSECGNRP